MACATARILIRSSPVPLLHKDFILRGINILFLSMGGAWDGTLIEGVCCLGGGCHFLGM